MFNLDAFAKFVTDQNGIEKTKLIAKVIEKFRLKKTGRAVYYCNEFAVRFSSAHGESFGNTVLALSSLRKVDDKPFVVCLVTPCRNYCYLANSTFLKKISHSSHQLREDKITGSFNGSDILRQIEIIDTETESVSNSPENFERLFAFHREIGFKGNLPRLVDETARIAPSGKKFEATEAVRRCILGAPRRAAEFVASNEASELKRDLDERVCRFRTEILDAALNENVNVRGRIIEYLVAGEDDRIRQKIIAALKCNSRLPKLVTKNALGDFSKRFESFHTETDIKTKRMELKSNPKGYNLDKMLEFLATPKSVFLFYFISIGTNNTVDTALVSIFQKSLLDSTFLKEHLAGRGSRGHSLFDGKAIELLIRYPKIDIDEPAALAFLEKVLNL